MTFFTPVSQEGARWTQRSFGESEPAHAFDFSGTLVRGGSNQRDSTSCVDFPWNSETRQHDEQMTEGGGGGGWEQGMDLFPRCLAKELSPFGALLRQGLRTCVPRTSYS